MDVDRDLVGKTITGVVASVRGPNAPREIWLLQFSDGTHVEFVSPAARASLRRAVQRSRNPGEPRRGLAQLTLNVA